MGYSLTQNNDEVKFEVLMNPGQRAEYEAQENEEPNELEGKSTINIGNQSRRNANETDGGETTGEFLAAKGLEDEPSRLEDGSIIQADES